METRRSALHEKRLNAIRAFACEGSAPTIPKIRRVYVKFARSRLIIEGGKITRDQCNGPPEMLPVPVRVHKSSRDAGRCRLLG